MPKKKMAETTATITIKGARVHNLKNVSLELPRNKLIVFTGVSGSGKSSLAFDTIYAEGQRRFVESLSSYARQFLERMDKPDVDLIKGIGPAVAIGQKSMTRNPRSTVGTMTEIYDYLRLLFARIGKTYCAKCGKLVQRDSVQTVIERLNSELGRKNELKLYVAFPIHDHPKATLAQEIDNLKKQGFSRLLHRDTIIDIQTDSIPNVSKQDLLVLVDRLVYRSNGRQSRLADSVDTAFINSGGWAVIKLLDGGEELRFNQHFDCASCGIRYEEPDPRLFSFNNPFGACPKCQGFGRSLGIDPDLVVPDRSKSIRQGAIYPWTTPKWRDNLSSLLRAAPSTGLRVDVPFSELSPAELKIVYHGTAEFDGVYEFFRFIERKSYKIHYRYFLSRFRSYTTCEECGGSRLRKEALNVKVGGKTIHELGQLPLDEAHRFVNELELTTNERTIARRIIEELHKRIAYLVTIGVGYLTIDRLAHTLSGGESQRINLATALGSSLVGSVYVLDEPSIGLHPRDTGRLIEILVSLRNAGNTVIVVEHDAAMMRAADTVVDLGPGAGELGGEIVYCGPLDGILRQNNSLTGKYLSGTKSIPVPVARRKGNAKQIVVHGASEHNLQNIDVKIPLGKLVCITGVSGSGKSTLVHEILYPTLKRNFGTYENRVGRFRNIDGVNNVSGVELVDQSPIGRTPRSNPITYIKAFDSIRELLSAVQASKVRGFVPGSFSFNIPGGRCETCEGSGVQLVEMQFLADITLPCESCGGKRFKKEVLEVRLRGKNVDDILNMTVTEALLFFQSDPRGRKVVQRLKVLDEVGLGYIRLGQSATTLSGGEAQRVKLAAHLVEHSSNRNFLFIFDEPTTGLHFDDISKLLKSFEALIEQGHSVLIIEHNLDVIKCADWIIDLGPEAGSGGGKIVAEGTPELVARSPKSHTGRFLKEVLKRSSKRIRADRRDG